LFAGIASGLDVYLFLTGMMLLAEIARAERIFDWTAAWALEVARGSGRRLFGLVFALCVAVTVFLSNDATVVVLTPAVVAIAKRAKLAVVPYAFTCAFVANAASFVLPISNPANLVVYGGRLPTLGPWLAAYGLPSLVSIALTYGLLRWHVRRDLRAEPCPDAGGERPGLRKRALGALIVSALIMVVASSAGWPLGTVTLGVALASLAVVSFGDPSLVAGALRRIDYGILLIAAGLFGLVGMLDAAGGLNGARRLLDAAAAFGHPQAQLAAAFGIALLSNVFNNLPIGLAARYSLDMHAHAGLVPALLVGIDLGPNLFVTGSLATLLWMSALRSEGVPMNPLRFLAAGAVVMPLTLALSVLCCR
jgi:arsenical pump membrane protein